MRSVSAIIKDTASGVVTKTRPGELLPGILVPIDSSAGAFNALEYAVKLAKVLHTSIHLFHITDADELGESGNPVVVSRMLDRLDRKASNCVVSLREMIEESGVNVFTAESRVGNVGLLLSKRIAFLAPSLIVIGRESLSDSTINSLIADTACPLLVVPASSAPQLPTSITLAASDRRIDSKKKLEILFKLIQRTTKELTIIGSEKNVKDRDERIQQMLGSLDKYTVISKFQEIESLDSARVSNFVQSRGTDLLCTIRRKRTFWWKIFGRNHDAELVFRLNIPSLII